MIRLNRNFTPLCLAPAEVKRLTAEFISTGKSVWHIEQLKSGLLALSDNKCSYCECDVSEESKYMEVEHFQDKYSYPALVVAWDNLLPSCKRCNGSKSTHDVIAEPIVNPFKMEPKEHFYLKNYRVRSKTPEGKFSIEALDLNDFDRAVKVRFDIGEAVLNAVDNAMERLDKYEGEKTVRRRNALIKSVKKILEECQRDSAYAATAATVLTTEEDFNYIILRLKNYSLWSDEFDSMYAVAMELAFDMSA